MQDSHIEYCFWVADNMSREFCRMISIDSFTFITNDKEHIFVILLSSTCYVIPSQHYEEELWDIKQTFIYIYICIVSFSNTAK